MCHIAVWSIYGHDCRPHGKEFKDYASQFNSLFTGDQVDTSHQIVVTTKHGFTVDCKFQYICSNKSCDAVYHRHSKSINTDVYGCGKCGSKLVLHSRGRVIRSEPLKSMNPYTMFVKQNFSQSRNELLKSRPPDQKVRHGEVMALLAEKWNQMKISS
jgi:hypothetical protein